MMSLSGSSGRTIGRPPFTPTQWEELEHQALIYKYMVSGVPVPPELIFSIRRSLDTSLVSRLLPHQSRKPYNLILFISCFSCSCIKFQSFVDSHAQSFQLYVFKSDSVSWFLLKVSSFFFQRPLSITQFPQFSFDDFAT